MLVSCSVEATSRNILVEVGLGGADAVVPAADTVKAPEDPAGIVSIELSCCRLGMMYS